MKVKDLKQLIIDADLPDNAEVIVPKTTGLVRARANVVRIKRDLTLNPESNKEPNALLISQDG